MQNVTNGLKVIKTGYIDFDKIFGGLISDDYIILAARTSVGKSSFAISLCYNLIKQNIRVAYLTLEMQPIAILNKLIAIQQNIPLLEITNPIKENKIDNKIIAGCEFIRDSNIIVETARGKNDLYVKSKIRKYSELGAKIVVIDLLDKIKSSEKAEKRQIQLANISRSLFEASKEYNIIVLALVQLNREAAKTEKPMLHHLREAGDFEQDADVVLLLDRPEQQDNLTFWDKSDATGKARLIKAKDRMGATGFIDLGFNKQTTYFHDLNFYNRYENEIQAF
jgi:replicative DNA helicase